jgi:hypothetical protein
LSPIAPLRRVFQPFQRRATSRKTNASSNSTCWSECRI